MANKQDVEGALTAVEITDHLKLHSNKDHAWQIQVRFVLVPSPPDPSRAACSLALRPGVPLPLPITAPPCWPQPCSAISGTGLNEGMDWIAHTLRNKR